MDYKHYKDFAITLAILAVISFFGFSYYLYNQVEKVPEESRYRNMALSEDLLSKIESIEKSIQDRKNFVFTVTKDPLEQNLIVKTQEDLLKQWETRVKSMLRLAAIYVEEDGGRKAQFDFQGKQEVVSVGDTVANAKILEIEPDKVVISRYGSRITKTIEPIPPKPEAIADKNTKAEREYVW